jgi:hypothetical protein
MFRKNINFFNRNFLSTCKTRHFNKNNIQRDAQSVSIDKTQYQWNGICFTQILYLDDNQNIDKKNITEKQSQNVILDQNTILEWNGVCFSFNKK